jgi:hypothetical protein
MAGSFGPGNELSSSIKEGDFLTSSAAINFIHTQNCTLEVFTITLLNNIKETAAFTLQLIDTL